MRLLLDTHAFIWWAIRKERLSPTAIRLCGDGNNDLFLSMVICVPGTDHLVTPSQAISTWRVRPA
jgi:hypothetical protein